MSGQDEKWATICVAENQYGSLMGLLRRVSSSDPYSLLPTELEEAVKEYEKGRGVIVGVAKVEASNDFSEALKKYWRQIRLPKDSKSELEEIVKIEERLWR